MDQNLIVINVQKVTNHLKINKNVKNAKKIILIQYREAFAQNVLNLRNQMNIKQSVSQKILLLIKKIK